MFASEKVCELETHDLEIVQKYDFLEFLQFFKEDTILTKDTKLDGEDVVTQIMFVHLNVRAGKQSLLCHRVLCVLCSFLYQ